MQIKFNINTVAMILAGTALVEGLAIAMNSHPVSIEGVTGFKASTVMLVGLQLAVIGAVVLISLFLTEYRPMGKMIDRALLLLPLLGGAVIVLEGIAAAYLAGPVMLEGVGSIQALYVSAFAAQLFLLGAGLVVLWLFRDRRCIGLFVNLGALALISSTGVFVASMASNINWAGVGGLKASTMALAGIILVALGLAGIILFYLEGWKLLGNELFGMEVWSWGVICLGVLIALAGAVVISFSAPIVLMGQQSFGRGAVAAAGLIIFILGLLAFAPAMLSGKVPLPIKKVTVRSTVFAVLLLPFAFLV